MRQAGLAWGLTAALAYATMNVCLRAAAVQVDPLAGALVRSVPVSLLGWLLVGIERRRGGARWPGWRALLPLVLTGLMFNVSGNGSFQLALALGGLALTVPVSQSAVLWGGALGGRWLMGEMLTRRGAAGLLLLVVALPLLSLGVQGGAPGPIWLAALAAALAGLSYGAGNAILRHTVLRHRLGQGLALATVASSGLVSLLALVLAGPGPAALTGLETGALGWLVVAGLFNAIALGSLARALSLLPVARVNALSTLQTALSAAGGVAVFAEPLTGALLLGLALSLTGVLLAQHGRGKEPRRPWAAARICRRWRCAGSTGDRSQRMRR
jgi:drug/metabolite transporter (DMT)-like permease